MSSHKKTVPDNKTYIDLSRLPDFLRLTDRQADAVIAYKTGNIIGYFDRCGFKKAVIGLSGGIDSAVSAALAAKALGPENIIVLRLPCGRGGESLRIAAEVAEALGIPGTNVFTIDIADAVEASYRAAVAVFGESGNVGLLRGNMAARERMKMLEHACSLHGAILLGTENRTEHYLTYYTIGGDNISGIEPFLDLWKVQIYRIAARLGLPDSVLRRVPTAELWAGQTDEGELGVDYLTMDTVLGASLDQRLKAPAIAKKFGLPLKTVQKILDHVESKKGKREAPFIVS